MRTVQTLRRALGTPEAEEAQEEEKDSCRLGGMVATTRREDLVAKHPPRLAAAAAKAMTSRVKKEAEWKEQERKRRHHQHQQQQQRQQSESSQDEDGPESGWKRVDSSASRRTSPPRPIVPRLRSLLSPIVPVRIMPFIENIAPQHAEDGSCGGYTSRNTRRLRTAASGRQ